MDTAFLDYLYQEHQKAQHQVSDAAICELIEGVVQLLFPTLSDRQFKSPEELKAYAKGLKKELHRLLKRMQPELPAPAKELTNGLMERLPHIHRLLMEDAMAILEGDPAARHLDEVIRTYPGFKAVVIYRLANVLYRLQIPLLPRVLSEYAHAKTGIDVHPGAVIGTHFCIDHGTGVVIGETAVIGNNVKIYQGVTLGALSVDKAMAFTKRHPTIENNVVIYAGATILGGNTVVGANSIIGGNVWLTESVPPYSRVYHRSQIHVSRSAGPTEALNYSI
ncbi:serine O-acetyltransferase EpsC [Pontibacter beigongshangensis]|uniref:serine O-acetyltransferase EpsC n=1 Tax=Pontibacter beigongshangensis TaxID=2574733 RepID=UPI0016509B9C|nr:serine O-acetyltransferase EpsC [Pontibacter beigongshangensis]